MLLMVLRKHTQRSFPVAQSRRPFETHCPHPMQHFRLATPDDTLCRPEIAIQYGLGESVSFKDALSSESEISFSAASTHFWQRGLLQQYGAVLVRVGLLLDGALIFAGLYLTVRGSGLRWDERCWTLGLLAVLVFEIIASFRHLYRSWRLIRLRYEILEILFLLSVAYLVVFVAVSLGASRRYEAFPKLLAFWYILSFVAIAGMRVALRLVLRYYRAYGRDHRKVAFIGATETALRLSAVFRDHQWMGIDSVGIYDDRFANPARCLVGREHLAGNVRDLLALVQTETSDISAIYIALPMAAEKRIKRITDRFAETTASIYFCPTLLDFDLLNARWDDVFGHPVISIVGSPFDGLGHFIKRAEDLGLVLLALPFILLPMAIIAIAVKLTSPGPIIFAQNRHGLDGQTFKIWKFRTMFNVESDDEFVQARQGDARITPIGAILRRLSLDELPQFFNVLVGDMSVVGPRPAPIKYNEEHRRTIHRYMIRHKVKPGITGWAQVNGSRGETTTFEKIEERTRYDLQYIRNWSIWLDLRILLRTAVMLVGDLRSG